MAKTTFVRYFPNAFDTLTRYSLTFILEGTVVPKKIKPMPGAAIGPSQSRMIHTGNSDLARASADEASDAARSAEYASLNLLVELVSDVVHDINNPLGTALSSCQIALRLLPGDSPDQLVTCLERAVSSIRRASDVVTNLTGACGKYDAGSEAVEQGDEIQKSTTNLAN
jgi:signal transduction histidine kinase